MTYVELNCVYDVRFGRCDRVSSSSPLLLSSVDAIVNAGYLFLVGAMYRYLQAVALFFEDRKNHRHVI